MRVEDVAKRVEEIVAVAPADYEAAHAKEDQLYRDVLETIADRTGDAPALLAAEALKTQLIDFDRHCA